MNRREFFRLHRGQDVGEISGEEWFMRYVDSKVDGSEERFQRKLSRELSSSVSVRLQLDSWMDAAELEKLAVRRRSDQED